MKSSSGDAWATHVLRYLSKPGKERVSEKEQFDGLESDAIRRVLNQGRWDEARYLIILYACSRTQPYALQAKTCDGLQAFKKVVLRDIAKEYGLDFEFFHGANKMLEDRLEKAFGYVKSFREDGGSTLYAITSEGEKIAESALEQASKKATGLETTMLPNTLLDKFRQDLYNRAKEKNLDQNIVKELLAEYEGHDAAIYTPEVNAASRSKKIKLDARTVTIGRTEENTVSFPNDRFISRKHAKVEWVDGGHWIQDLRSKNGTWRVNEDGSRVKIEREKVKPESIYLLGTTKLVFAE